MAAPGLYDISVYDTATYDSFTVGGPTVELFLNSVWVDITAYVRVADGIRIRRGVQDWQAQPQAATCDLTLDNRDGRFSPRYTSGAYYPYLMKNTQLRVSVRDRLGALQVRFWGNVPTWPTGWDLSGRDVQSPITAYGPRRRLTVGAVPLQSPYKRAEIALPNVAEYWPMEDGDTATSFASALNGHAPLSFSGDVTPGSDDTFVASTALPVFGDTGTWTANFRSITPLAAGVVFRGLLKVTGSTGGAIFRIDTSGAHFFQYEYAPGTDMWSFTMTNYATGLVEYNSVTAGTLTTGWANIFRTTGGRVALFLKQNGTGIDFGVTALAPGASSGFTDGGTVTSSTLGNITDVSGRMDVITGATMALGHVTVETKAAGSFDIYDLAAVLTGYAGETAADRWTRLTAEAGVSTSVNTGTVHTPVGPQGEATLLELLDEAAYTDNGISTEGVTTNQLVFIERSKMYGNAFLRTFSHPSMTDTQVVDDDQNLQNDVTVMRNNGGSSRAVATTGGLTPALVGTYAVEYDLNLYGDAQTVGQAAWRLAQGVVDQPRFPVIQLDYVQQGSSAPKDDLVAMREGDPIAITSLPGFSGASTSAQYVRCLGWQETITQTGWQFTINTVPADVWYFAFIMDSASFGIMDTDRVAL